MAKGFLCGGKHFLKWCLDNESSIDTLLCTLAGDCGPDDLGVITEELAAQGFETALLLVYFHLRRASRPGIRPFEGKLVLERLYETWDRETAVRLAQSLGESSGFETI